MINVHNFMNAMKITWVRRFLTSSSKWIHIVNSTIAGWSDFTLYGAEYIKSLNTDENTFWSDTCLALYKFVSLCTPSTWEDFLLLPIWYNNDIKVGGKTMCYKNYLQKGISVILDLICQNNQLVDLDTTRNNMNINTHILYNIMA